jgi:hypothetical protein
MLSMDRVGRHAFRWFTRVTPRWSRNTRGRSRRSRLGALQDKTTERCPTIPQALHTEPISSNACKFPSLRTRGEGRRKCLVDKRDCGKILNLQFRKTARCHVTLTTPLQTRLASLDPILRIAAASGAVYASLHSPSSLACH